MVNDLKRYAYIECDYLGVIQAEILSMIEDKSTKEGWNFFDKMDIVKAPSLLQFCKDMKLIIQDFSIIYLTEPLIQHVDSLPQVVKINIPILNTEGWSNVWYGITEEQLESSSKVTLHMDQYQHGLTHERVADLILPEIDRIDNLDKIIAFNSRIPHSVDMNSNALTPRIVASLTFKKQPIELLQ